MRVGGQIVAIARRHQFAQAWIAGRIGAQHQGVDEEADQFVERAVGAPGDRAADRNVGAGPKPASSAERPACNTMNRLAWLSRASASSGVELGSSVTAHGRPDSWRRRVVAGRLADQSLGQVLRAFPSSTRAAGQSRCRDRSPRQAPGVARACSRHIAPAAARARAPARKPRRIGAAPGRATAAPGPAVARNVVQQQTAAHARARQAQTDARAAAARWPDRSLGGPRSMTASWRAASVTRVFCRSRPARRRRDDVLPRYSRRLREDRAQALVARDDVAQRRLQRRSSSAPVRRMPSGCCRSRSALPGDAGTTAGAAQTTVDLCRAAPCAQRRAAPPRPHPVVAPGFDGRRLEQRADRDSTPRPARMRLISRVASSEWPPRSKKLSLMPTRRVRAPRRTASRASPPAGCAGRARPAG